MRNNNKLKLKKSIIILMIVLLFFVSSGHIAYAQQINFFSWLKSFKNFISRSLSFFNISNKDTIKNTTQFIFTEKPTEQPTAEKTTAREETESGRLNLPQEVEPPNKDYWVYIRTYDKPEVSLGETAGRSKKGDIVQVLDASIYTTPSETEKKEWLIIKVSGLTQEQIETMMQSWQEQTGVNEDGSPIEITKAYRKYKLDIDELKTKEGITIKEGLWQKKIDKTDVINQIEVKDKKDISRYYWQSVKYAITKNVTGLKRKIAGIFVPRARAATINTRTVIPAGGGDYASLNLWEDARNADLVTLGYIEIANCSGATADTTAVAIAGWTTGVDNYIEINGDNTTGKWNTSAYRLTVTSGSAIRVYTGYVRFNGLQVISSSTGAYDCGIRFSVNSLSSDGRVSNSIIQRTTGATNYGALGCEYYNFYLKVWNTIVYVDSNPLYALRGGYSGYVNVYNSTVYGAGANTGIDKATCYNTIAYNFTTDFTNSAGNYNFSKDDTAPGANSIHGTTDGKTPDFVSTTGGSEDFHLQSTSDAIDVGTTDPGSGLFSDDIDGQTRTVPWDIGADEYVSTTNPIRIKGGVKIKGGVRIKNNE